MANLLLIESPGKLKKLSQILGSGWIVKASLGHIRELANDGEDALGFDLEGDRVHCRYELRGGRTKSVLQDLRQAVKQATNVYIATDPDREGETIGWHLMQELRLKQPKRVTYTEITSSIVRAAIANPRTLNQNLVAAGRARDCLDKLVGYKGSKHLVWALNNGAKSMGRVQSATLHLLCQREKEIQVFVPQDYWSVWVEYAEGFKAFYRRGNLEEAAPKIEPADDAAEKTEQKSESDRVSTQEEADRLVAIAKAHPHQIVKVEQKNTSQSPPAAFITSTLQQAAGAKLRFNPEQTMKIAQSLYEVGHITYMRTDSVVLSDQFCDAVRQYLEQNDPDNVPPKVVRHRSKAGAQEAHEAIRPTDVYLLPEQIQTRVRADEAKLYELIWNRAVASLCAPARLAKTRVITQSGSVYWEARGQVLTFPGYTRYWNNISEDLVLPPVQEGQSLTLKEAGADKKRTQPPPRYTEPKLVQLMERKGVGRPSTYSPTIKTLKERQYVQLSKSNLQPTPLGMELDNFLEQAIPDLIQPEFTARMESELDAIASGKLEWERYLTSWSRDYFTPALNKAIAEIKTISQTQPREKGNGTTRTPTETTSIQCPNCGHQMTKVFSKSQKLKADHFLSCDSRSNGCGTVMFLNVKANNYELPYSERSTAKPTPETLNVKTNNTKLPTKRRSKSKPDLALPKTKNDKSPTKRRAKSKPNTETASCPVCHAALERFEYKKDGQTKTAWRCSSLENRRDKCKDVAFWPSPKGGFWSPKWGTLPG